MSTPYRQTFLNSRGARDSVSAPSENASNGSQFGAMLHLTQLNYLTLEGSRSAVSRAKIARKEAFCSIFRDLEDLHSFAHFESHMENTFAPWNTFVPLHLSDLKKAYFVNCSMLFTLFQEKSPAVQSSSRFLLKRDHFFRNFRDCPEDAAKGRYSDENREKNGQELDLSSIQIRYFNENSV